MRKVASLVIILVMSFFVLTLSSCDVQEEPTTDEIVILYENANNTVKVGDTLNLLNVVGSTMVSYTSSNEEVISIRKNNHLHIYQGYALKEGAALISALSGTGEAVGEYLVVVTSNAPQSITLTGEKKVNVGEVILLNAEVEPKNSGFNVVWKSSDESIAKVSINGIVEGISAGFALITASVNGYDEIYDELLIQVNGSSYSLDDEINNTSQDLNKKIDLSTLSNVFEPIIMKAKTFVVGVNSYLRNNKEGSVYESASGVIYKRYCVLSDGSLVEDNGEVTNFSAYKYYVITCKHVIDKAKSVEVYYDNEKYDAVIIAYDKKIDLGVITFTTDRYFSVAEFGDSSEVETGEFVIAYGSNYGEDYDNSPTLGVVSYNSRYVSTDTDGDETNDWDSLYIQHDCAIGDGSSGGPLLNMKGQVIGINSKKISSDKIDNMGFAIPSNLTVELCSQLAQGIVPERPVFKISVLTVVDILKSEYLLSVYPIPEGITYGIYIAEVDKGGVGDKCGMKAGDIIVSFDGKKITYSYELRAAMGEVIIGSGEEINVVVYRDGEYITLKAVF